MTPDRTEPPRLDGAALDYVVRLAEQGGIGRLLADLDERVLSPRGLGRASPAKDVLEEVERRAAAAFAAARWLDALAWYGELCRAPEPAVDYRKVLLAVGRCLLYLEDQAAALLVFERLAAIHPDDFDSQFYLGRARQLLHRYEAAVDALSRANLLRPGTHKCLLAMAQACHAGLSGGYGVAEPLEPAARYRDLATIAYRAAIAAAPKDRAAYLGLARLRAETGNVDGALELLGQGAKAGAPRRPLLEEAGLIAVRSGRLDLAERQLAALRACAPDHPLPGRIERMLRELREPAGEEGGAPADLAGPPTLVLLGGAPALLPGLGSLLGRADLIVRPADVCADVEARLRVRDGELVALGDAAALRQAASEWRTLGRLLRGDAAGVAYGGGRGDGQGRGVLWRRAALLERLAAADPAAPFPAAHEGFRAGVRLASVPVQADRRDAPPEAARLETMALVSRKGSQRFGGAEHFLHEAAAFYAAQGCRVLFVGTGEVREPVLEPGEDGTPSYTVPDDARALRRVLEAERVDLVHALSGLGHLCAEAVGDTRTRLVYGIHYWREFLQSPANHDFYYPYVGRKARPHPGFGAILNRADAIYANSPYVAELCQRHLGLSPVEIPSTVDDAFGRAPCCS